MDGYLIVKTKPIFHGKCFIANWLLNQICAWLWGMRGEDGIDVRHDDDAIVIGISPDVLGSAVAGAAGQDWKCHGRLNGETLQYAVNSGTWDGTAWSSALAGTYLTPVASTGSLASVAWTTATAGGIYLHLSASTGTITASIDQTAGSDSQFLASPGIANFHIADIAADGTITQHAWGIITCPQIPAFFAGYAPASIQSFQHLANAAPSWDTDGDCDA